MIWKEQILMEIEGGKPLVLHTRYGSSMSDAKQKEILHSLWEGFGYMRHPDYSAFGAIYMHGQWVEEVPA